MTETVLVFARPPLAGQVKTRLAATLGDDLALTIYRQLLTHTLEQVAASGRSLVLYAAAESDELARLARYYGGRLARQQGTGLGERMVRALSAELAGAQAVLLLGSDCPGLAAQHLAQGFEALACVDVVLGPATDGGFWAIGSRPLALWRRPDVFRGVRYGGPHARSDTLQRLRAQGVEPRPAE